MVEKNMFFSFSKQNHAESSRNFLKESVLDPKHVKVDQNSDFGHVRAYSWLHRLRNTQGKIYGTFLGNIYGIYKEYIRMCFWLFCVINIYEYPSYVDDLFHIDFLNMFHIFSLVCFLIYGVKSRSGHDRSKIVPFSS